MKSYDTAYRWTAWSGIGLLAVGSVWLMTQGYGKGSLVLGGFVGVAAAIVLLRRHLPRLFDLLFVTAALINAAGYTWQLFSGVPYYDDFVHFFTTFTITLALAFLLYKSMLAAFVGHGVLFFITVASLGLAVGALWEIFEHIVGMALGFGDTIGDLISDAIGAALAGAVAAHYIRRRPEIVRNPRRTGASAPPARYR